MSRLANFNNLAVPNKVAVEVKSAVPRTSLNRASTCNVAVEVKSAVPETLVRPPLTVTLAEDKNC